MITVNSKSDIKEALQRGETEFYTTNKDLLNASALVGQCNTNLSSLNEGTQFALSDKTIIIITMLVLSTAISLYALYMGYNVDVDLKNGTIKLAKEH